MAHDISKFQVGEVIHGRGIDIRIVEINRISGLIIAQKLAEDGLESSFFHIQRIKFAPQTYFDDSWVSLPPQPRFVLCLRADGTKVLG